MSASGFRQLSLGLPSYITAYTDTVDELTTDAGVTVDGVRFKDGVLRLPGTTTTKVDQIDEYTTDNGVAVETVLLKDGEGDFPAAGAGMKTDELEERTLNVGVSVNSDLNIVAGKSLSADTITETTGGSGVTIDSLQLKDGAVVKHPTHKLWGRLTKGSNQTVNDATYTTMAWTSNGTGDNSAWPIVSGVLKIPTDGVYLVRFNCYCNTTAATDYRIAILKDGSIYKELRHNNDAATATDKQAMIHLIEPFTAGETLTAQIYQDTTANGSFTAAGASALTTSRLWAVRIC